MAVSSSSPPVEATDGRGVNHDTMVAKETLISRSSSSGELSTIEKDPWSSEQVILVAENWKLTEKDTETLVTLGGRLRDISHPHNIPDQVIRYVKARSRSIDAAEKMFRNMIKWRLENKVDTILDDHLPPRLIRDYIPGAVMQGYDKDGDPIYCERVGAAHTPEMRRRFGDDHLIKHAIWIRESISKGAWIEEYERTQKRPVRQLLVVEDLHGLSMAHLERHILKVFEAVTRLDQDNYPELAKKIINVNSPFILRMAWSLVKHFFDPNVAEKLVFCSHNHTEEVLKQYIDDLSVLPQEIVPQGRGKAVPGLPQKFTGGPLPPIGQEGDDDDDDHERNLDISTLPGPSSQQRKETAETEMSSPERDAIDSSDTDSSGGFSNKSHLSWATPVRTLIHKRELKKMKQKEEEISLVRTQAAERNRPKVRSRSQQDRLDQLSHAKERRQQHSQVGSVSKEKKSWSEKLTDRLSTHSKTRRFCSMLGLLWLFIVLLHPELVEMVSGVELRPAIETMVVVEDQEHAAWWIDVLQGVGLFGYLFLCTILHFGVCDIALVYAFLSMDLGSKMGRDVKKYYSDVVRVGVAAISLSIYILSLVKALANLLISALVASSSKGFRMLIQQIQHETESSALVERGLEVVNKMMACTENTSDDFTITTEDPSLEVYNEIYVNSADVEILADGSFSTNDSVSFLPSGDVDEQSNLTTVAQEKIPLLAGKVSSSFLPYLKSLVAVDDLDTALSTWQAKAFGTARLLFSYTCVFLLVFLFLFHYTASSRVVAKKPSESKVQTKEIIQEEEEEYDDALSQITEETGTAVTVSPPSTPSRETTSSKRGSEKRRTPKRFLFRKRKLGVVKENSSGEMLNPKADSL